MITVKQLQEWQKAWQAAEDQVGVKEELYVSESEIDFLNVAFEAMPLLAAEVKELRKKNNALAQKAAELRTKKMQLERRLKEVENV